MDPAPVIALIQPVPLGLTDLDAPAEIDAANVARLGLACNVLSTPTSIVMSFSDPSRGDDLAETTQVVRVPPGEVNLKRLCQVDEIADRVIAGELDFVEGRRQLRAIGERPPSRSSDMAGVLSFGVSSAAIEAGRRKGASAPQIDANSAMASLSVDTTVRVTLTARKALATL